MTAPETTVLSYGGGRQTVALCILVRKGLVPPPDRIVIADTGREKRSTWDWMGAYTAPLMREIGLEIEVAPRGLSKVDLYAHNGDILMPVYTATGKLPAFCSNEALALSPEERLQLLQTLDAIDAMLDGLPHKALGAFVLSQLDGLTYAQIAERLAISERTVKRHMALGFEHCLALVE